MIQYVKYILYITRLTRGACYTTYYHCLQVLSMLQFGDKLLLFVLTFILVQKNLYCQENKHEEKTV